MTFYNRNDCCRHPASSTLSSLPVPYVSAVFKITAAIHGIHFHPQLPSKAISAKSNKYDSPLTMLLSGRGASLLLLLSTCKSFQLTPSRISTKRAQITFSKESHLHLKQTHIYDGGELQSFLLLSNPSSATAPSATQSTNIGSVTFVTSSSEPRIIGIQNDSSTTTIDNESAIPLATIPPGISEADAISTAAASLVGICVGIPRVGGVGGSDTGFYGGKAVIVGGNDYACFLAEGLTTLGIDTSIVSTGSVKLRNSQVRKLGPAVATVEDEIGFTTFLGQFDTLIDTIANERKSNFPSNDGSSVIQLLSTRHECNTYISTLSKSQSIIKKEGVIFGPGKANAHVKSMESSSSKCIPLVPPSDFGSILQTLLDNKIVYPSKSNKSIVARGWNLQDFWEETSWPRDSNGSGVRFGFPTVEEDDLDEVFRRERLSLQRRSHIQADEDEDDTTGSVQVKVEENPYVTQIVGTEGLVDAVISQRKSSVVFVAMRSCRTCKAINPVFTRIAREYEGDLMFAKADATGSVGKALGKSLGLVSVPSFVLFKNGIRYGAVQTSKLPSNRLQKAIDDLESGRDFDPACEEGDD